MGNMGYYIGVEGYKLQGDNMVLHGALNIKDGLRI